jgi:hypothetical protein
MRRPGGEEWPKLIAEYETSGQSQKEFCADRDLPFNTFPILALPEVQEGPLCVPVRRPSSCPVEVVRSAAPEGAAAKARASEAAIEIALPSGVQVRLPSNASASFVGELIAALK